ncbi:MAG TPA: hypothetical protein VNT32_14500 [Thermoleophilaceae bacterium]|nr:hypothetical protein [Thermoleophilaceae bacterium]
MKRLNVIGCALSGTELEARARLAGRLAPAVESVERRPRAAEIAFGPDVDEELVLDLARRERECCSFFEFAWSASDRRLEVAVPEDRFQPSLDAVVAAVTGDL